MAHRALATTGTIPAMKEESVLPSLISSTGTVTRLTTGSCSSRSTSPFREVTCCQPASNHSSQQLI